MLQPCWQGYSAWAYDKDNPWSRCRVVNCGILCGDVIELFSFLGTAHMLFEQTPLSAQQFVVLIKGQPVPKIQTGLKTS